MTYEVGSLEDTSFGDVYECFVKAFADYAVNVGELPEPGLLRRARKNNWAPELSFGAWSDGCLIAITLIGVDKIAGELRAYDIATGIVPEHRGKGLAGGLLDAIIPRLREQSLAALQLEVLEDNAPAIRAYEKAGFTRTRTLRSLQGTANSISAPVPPFEIHPITASGVCKISGDLEFEPSFEQRDQAIYNLGEELMMLGGFEGDSCVSAIAYDPQTNWLMRLVTRREYRRRGHASALLSSLAGCLSTNSPIKAINVDENDSATIGTLSRCGLVESLSQWEMRLEL